ncbi:MAG: acyl-CoA thioesterase [Ignavibacteria bacterium]|nr:acyl-CoA thioesterase [Ignavibacteria bacterium]
MNIDEITPSLILKFKHSYKNKVRFHEVDSFGVVHNIVFLYWIEIAQGEYLEALGIEINPNTFTNDFPLMKVHNEIDYFLPLHLGENYEVRTRISWYKRSSFEFQNLVLNEKGYIVCFARSILVHLDKCSFSSTPLPTRFLELVRKFECGDVEQLKDLNGPE